MFIDRAKIRVKAGDGGDGVTAFRREKFVPRGGPSGGDGGVGGDVWIEADEGLNTLLHLRYNPEHKAERGRHGEGSNRFGKDGESLTIKVPVGTQVFDAGTNELLFDFTESGQRHLAAKGGKAVGVMRISLRRQNVLRNTITPAGPARNANCSWS